jgi:hypothetical protein
MIILMVIKEMITLLVVQTLILLVGEGQDIFVCNQVKDTVLDFKATEGIIRSNDCEALLLLLLKTYNNE